MTTPAKRDLRLDLFRGLALLWIFLDHIPGNPLSWLTVRNYGLSDAAEIFVFISGYAAALAYSRAMRQQGLPYTTLHIWRRCWQIYSAHLVLLLVLIVLAGAAAKAQQTTQPLNEANVSRLLAAPLETLSDALWLAYRPINMDVLPLYTVLLLLFPALLWLLLRLPLVAGAAALLCYGLARSSGLNLPAGASGEGWFFNPFTWQLLFLLGSLLALYPALLTRLKAVARTIDALALLYLFTALLLVISWRLPALHAWLPVALTQWLYPIDKTSLDPLRLLHFLALAWLAMRLLPQNAALLQQRWLRPIILCGQNSLPVFCCGIFLSFAAHLLISASQLSATLLWLLHLALSSAGIVIMLTLAQTLSWYNKIGRTRPASKATAPTTPNA